MAVRAFYVDLHSWAIEDPEKWGPWVAPCPIPYGELRGFGARRRRVKERVDNRTRLRQPLLPALRRTSSSTTNRHATCWRGGD